MDDCSPEGSSNVARAGPCGRRGRVVTVNPNHQPKTSIIITDPQQHILNLNNRLTQACSRTFGTGPYSTRGWHSTTVDPFTLQHCIAHPVCCIVLIRDKRHYVFTMVKCIKGEIIIEYPYCLCPSWTLISRVDDGEILTCNFA